MKSLEPAPAISQIISPLFRIHAHHLIFGGYLDARHQIKPSDDEPAITGFITSAIKNRLRAPNPPKWYKYYFVSDDPPVEGEGRSGRSRLRLDIIIEANWQGRPEYCFEAKRLHKKGHPISKYVGADGMGCFISGRYASRYREAGMIGYVQSDSLEHWRERVLSEIDKQATALLLKSPPQNAKVIDELPVEWISKHDRNGVSSPIDIYHILLDCC